MTNPNPLNSQNVVWQLSTFVIPSGETYVKIDVHAAGLSAMMLLPPDQAEATAKGILEVVQKAKTAIIRPPGAILQGN